MANVNKAGKGNLLDKNSYVSNYQSQLVYMNDGVRLCSEACSCCWDTPLPDKYEDKVEYLAKRARIGHTSIFEHSNIIMLIKIPTRIYNVNAELLDFISSVRYLNVRYAIATSNTETVSSAYLLI